MQLPKQPDHMDKDARLARLYEHLKTFGLYVDPVLDHHGLVDHLLVSTSVITRGNSMETYLPLYDCSSTKAVGGLRG